MQKEQQVKIIKNELFEYNKLYSSFASDYLKYISFNKLINNLEQIRKQLHLSATEQSTSNYVIEELIYQNKNIYKSIKNKLLETGKEIRSKKLSSINANRILSHRLYNSNVIIDHSVSDFASTIHLHKYKNIEQFFTILDRSIIAPSDRTRKDINKLANPLKKTNNIDVILPIQNVQILIEENFLIFNMVNDNNNKIIDGLLESVKEDNIYFNFKDNNKVQTAKNNSNIIKFSNLPLHKQNRHEHIANVFINYGQQLSKFLTYTKINDYKKIRSIQDFINKDLFQNKIKNKQNKLYIIDDFNALYKEHLTLWNKLNYATKKGIYETIKNKNEQENNLISKIKKLQKQAITVTIRSENHPIETNFFTKYLDQKDEIFYLTNLFILDADKEKSLQKEQIATRIFFENKQNQKPKA